MEINDFIIKTKIPNFDKIKNKVLDGIDILPKMSFIHEGIDVSNTDFYYQKSISGEEQQNNHIYARPLEKYIRTHCDKLINLNRYQDVDITSIWFQQYEDNGKHGLHTHADGNIANVIYIELPNKDSATKFIWKGEEYSIDVEEGDIISFPSMLSHYSPTNYGKRKTIISFNMSAY